MEVRATYDLTSTGFVLEADQSREIVENVSEIGIKRTFCVYKIAQKSGKLLCFL